MAMQALVMGFGGTGAHILTALKELIVLKHGSKPDSIRFLLFDTIADWRPGKTVQILGGTAEETVAKGSEEKTSLDPATEYFYLGDQGQDLKTHVYDLLAPTGSPEKFPHLKDWLHAPWLKVHVKGAALSIVEGAAQQRQIGRFAIFQNADRIIGKVGQMIRELSLHAGNAAVNIWLVGSAAGGTGAGCLLDAAYLTRKAAGSHDVTVTGVIALPDVYNDKPGISRARAYSMFRELDRLQGLGIDRGAAEASMEFTSRVFYDARKQIETRVPKGIFDDLFYAGRGCFREEDRISFFTSVASAIDPYLDQNSGPVLVQEAVNKTAPALSFGASRLYVPEETFADIFAWEEVEKYLRGLAAPDDNRYVYHGSPGDRQDNARSKVANLLPLFSDLLQRSEDREDQKRVYVRNRVTPQMIITEWYRFGGGSIAGMELNQAQKSAVILTYTNPYISFLEPDETKVAVADRETKSYKESSEAKGQKESQDDSRDRFAGHLDSLTKRYLDRAGGERSFEKGRRQVFEIISANLRKKVDDLVLEELRQSTKFTADLNNLKQGTTLTRLWVELQHALDDGGPLKKIEATIGQFVATLNEEEASRSQQPVDALNQLKTSKSSGFFSIGAWVDDYQKQAREECYEYIRWYQKRELMKDMQELVRSVINRFGQWARLMEQAFNGLVRSEPESALFVVKEKILKRELYGRLNRLGKNKSALISCERFDPRDPDLTMQGYRDELKRCVQVRGDETLADETLTGSRWEASVTDNDLPQLKLVISGMKGANSYGPETMGRIHQILHDQFRERMAGYLENKDIFDYLLYAQRTRDLSAAAIAQLLNEAAEVLLTGRGEEECRLVFRYPGDPEKVNLAEAIRASMGGMSGLIVKDSEQTHSDKNSITLLKLKKPDMDDIKNLNECIRDYLERQVDNISGETYHDTEVYRAQVYHAFRAELEAWYIERKFCRRMGMTAEEHQIPPRVVRLLDEPAMMQAFVHCLATGAVEKLRGQGWIWHDTQNDRDVTLVSWDDNPSADCIQAAVVFALQQREGRRGGLIPITLAAAKQSAVDTAKSKAKTRDEMLDEFRKNLDQFLKDHMVPDELNQAEIVRMRSRKERDGLRKVLDFYANPETVTTLQHRMDL